MTDPRPTEGSSPERGPASRALLPIFFIVLVDIFGFTLVIPLLGIYAERFRATPTQATLLVSVYAVCQLVSGPFLGRASDKIGRKPMLLISQVGTFVGFIVLARAQALWVLYLARIIDGATAGNLSIAQAYISDNTRPEDRAKSFGIIGIAFGLGFFIGPFVTGTLSNYGLTAPIYAAAGLSMSSILLTLFFLPAGRPAKAPGATAGPGGQRWSILDWGAYAQYFKRPVLRGLFCQFFAFAFCFSTFTSGFALFAERTFRYRGHPFGPVEIGYVLAYVGLLGIILQGGLIGRLVKRFGEPALVSTGFASILVGYTALGLVHDIGPLVLVATVSSFGNGVLRPSLTSLISQRAGRHEQGVVLGLNQSIMSIAQISAPTIAGAVIGSGFLPLWAWVAAIGALFGLGFARWGSGLAREEQRAAARPATPGPAPRPTSPR
jgi:DHA1 family tetracycline resistance protein-like MFS transporter